MNQDATIVVLFVRVPIPGRVKTRLAVALGADGACSVYRAMVTDILSNITPCGFPIYLFYDGNDVENLPEEWITASSTVVPQTGDNIGERMAAAFEYCFSRNIDQVILVGSDIPSLDSSVMLSAATSLTSHEITLSPAHDGGYCLIGLRRDTYNKSIFRNIPWSTDQVLRATLDRCEHYRLNVELLVALQDIDTIDDLKSYCRSPSKQAVATNKYLNAIIYCVD